MTVKKDERIKDVDKLFEELLASETPLPVYDYLGLPILDRFDSPALGIAIGDHEATTFVLRRHDGWTPASVWHGVERELYIPYYLTTSDIRALWAELRPLLLRMVEGADSRWDGSNWVGAWSDDAHKAFQEAEKLIEHYVTFGGPDGTVIVSAYDAVFEGVSDLDEAYPGWRERPADVAGELFEDLLSEGLIVEGGVAELQEVFEEHRELEEDEDWE